VLGAADVEGDALFVGLLDFEGASDIEGAALFVGLLDFEGWDDTVGIIIEGSCDRLG
jgi:hypothetical protein